MHFNNCLHNIVEEYDVCAVDCEDGGGALLKCDGEGAMLRQCRINRVESFPISDAIIVVLLSVRTFGFSFS